MIIFLLLLIACTKNNSSELSKGLCQSTMSKESTYNRITEKIGTLENIQIDKVNMLALATCTNTQIKALVNKVAAAHYVANEHKVTLNIIISQCDRIQNSKQKATMIINFLNEAIPNRLAQQYKPLITGIDESDSIFHLIYLCYQNKLISQDQCMDISARWGSSSTLEYFEISPDQRQSLLSIWESNLKNSRISEENKQQLEQLSQKFRTEQIQ